MKDDTIGAHTIETKREVLKQILNLLDRLWWAEEQAQRKERIKFAVDAVHNIYMDVAMVAPKS